MFVGKENSRNNLKQKRGQCLKTYVERSLADMAVRLTRPQMTADLIFPLFLPCHVPCDHLLSCNSGMLPSDWSTVVMLARGSWVIYIWCLKTCQFDKFLPMHLTGCISDMAKLFNWMFVDLTNPNLSDYTTYGQV